MVEETHTNGEAQPGIALSPALQRFLSALGLTSLINRATGALVVTPDELLARLGVSREEIDNFLAQARASASEPPDDDLVALRRSVERQRIGRNIRRFRTALNLSLRDLHHLSGIDASYLSQLERGMRATSIDLLVQIAIVLNVTLAELVSEWPLW